MSSVNKKANFSFAAINPYAESNIISPKEKQYTGKDYEYAYRKRNVIKIQQNSRFRNDNFKHVIITRIGLLL